MRRRCRKCFVCREQADFIVRDGHRHSILCRTCLVHRGIVIIYLEMIGMDCYEFKYMEDLGIFYHAHER